MNSRRLAALALGCALALTAGLARAKEPVPRRVQELIKTMMVDYNTGDFEAALAKATEAYRIKPLPALLFNIGQFHKELHHWERAEFFFHRYLSERPDAPNRPQVEKLLAEIKDKSAEAPAPTPTPVPAPVIVESNPPPAAQPKSPSSAPAAATSSPEGSLSAEPPTHSHWAAYGLIGGGVLLGIGAGLASIPVYDMNQINQQVLHGASGLSYSKVQSADSQGATFQYVAIGVGIAAVLCAGSAIFAW